MLFIYYNKNVCIFRNTHIINMKACIWYIGIFWSQMFPVCPCLWAPCWLMSSSCCFPSCKLDSQKPVTFILWVLLRKVVERFREGQDFVRQDASGCAWVRNKKHASLTHGKASHAFPQYPKAVCCTTYVNLEIIFKYKWKGKGE